MWRTLERVLGWFGISRESRIDPLDATVQKVVRGASIEEVKALPCPYCGVLLTVRFESEGEWFRVCCTNKKGWHSSPRTFISTPPAGWESHVDREALAGEEHRLFRPYRSYIDETGSIQVRTSWWTSDSHACGYIEIGSDKPDADFWRWILSGTHRNDGVVTEAELELLRVEYLRSKLGS